MRQASPLQRQDRELPEVAAQAVRVRGVRASARGRPRCARAPTPAPDRPARRPSSARAPSRSRSAGARPRADRDPAAGRRSRPRRSPTARAAARPARGTAARCSRTAPRRTAPRPPRPATRRRTSRPPARRTRRRRRRAGRAQRRNGVPLASAREPRDARGEPLAGRVEWHRRYAASSSPGRRRACAGPPGAARERACRGSARPGARACRRDGRRRPRTWSPTRARRGSGPS